MEERRRTRFGPRGLILADGSDLPVFAAAMHYWRVDPRDWRACLEAVRALGFALVQTYVPWAVHEARARKYEWDGELDLGRFLDLAGEIGLGVIVRPGPHINAELSGFGFPDRILRDPAMQALTSRDTPAFLPAPPRAFPIPSYASTAFRAETARWLRAAGEVIAPRLAPGGPVVAIQVDNEMQQLFRVGAFDLDYHPDALAWWRDYSGEVGSDDAPRAWSAEHAGRCARWVGFKTAYAARALGWITEELRAAGLGEVARFHNLPPSDPYHVDLPAVQDAIDGPCGMDFYHAAADYHAYWRRALYLCGAAAPLPFAPEVGVGGPPWLLPMSAADQRSVTLGLLAAGVRAMSFYMTVDRDRWYGAAIGPGGAPEQPQHDFLKTLLATLGAVDWTSLRREAPVALMLSRADARYATASSVADPVTPVLTELLGLGSAGAAELALDDEARIHACWVTALERALALAQVPYAIVDEAAPVEQLTQYRAIIAPTLSRISRAAWLRLRAAATAGTRVVIGPDKPRFDEWGGALGADSGLPARVGLIRAESLEDLDGLAEDLAAVAGDLSPEFITAEAEHVDCSVFRDAAGAPRVLFVANRIGTACTADVVLPFDCGITDPFGGAAITRTDGIALIPLAPHEVRLLVLAP